MMKKSAMKATIGISSKNRSRNPFSRALLEKTNMQLSARFSPPILSSRRHLLIKSIAKRMSRTRNLVVKVLASNNSARWVQLSSIQPKHRYRCSSIVMLQLQTIRLLSPAKWRMRAVKLSTSMSMIATRWKIKQEELMNSEFTRRVPAKQLSTRFSIQTKLDKVQQKSRKVEQ